MECLCFHKCLFEQKINKKNLIINQNSNKDKRRSTESLDKNKIKIITNKNSKNSNKKKSQEWRKQFKCFFCGGKKCPYENYLTNPNSAIKGLNCDIIDNNIYAGQRPSNFLIHQYHLIEQFISKEIGLIVNLQLQGEHPNCGPGELDPISGYTYTPSLFTNAGIKVRAVGWKELALPDTMSFLLEIVKEITYTIKNEKKKVYIHCHTGNSRTGIIVACNFIYNRNITAKEACELAKHYRPKFFDKSEYTKYCIQFQDYLKSLKELFSNTKLPLSSFLKKQWKLEVSKTHINIPTILSTCLSKLQLIKNNPNRPYSNNMIYKALNGSLEISDEAFIQIKHLIRSINNGDWKSFEECESTVIISEVMYFWLDESVKHCVSPQKVKKIIQNDFYVNKIDIIIYGKCSNIEILYELYTLFATFFKKTEIDIINFIADFLEQIYPFSRFSQHSTNFGSDKNIIEQTNLSKDDTYQYESAIKKIAIYLLGFNIDMICNEEVMLSDNSIDDNIQPKEISKSFGSPIDKGSVWKEFSLYEIMQNMIKIIEFFRIYNIIQKKNNTNKLPMINVVEPDEYHSSSIDSSSDEPIEGSIEPMLFNTKTIKESEISNTIDQAKRWSIMATNDKKSTVSNQNHLYSEEYSLNYFKRNRSTSNLTQSFANIKVEKKGPASNKIVHYQSPNKLNLNYVPVYKRNTNTVSFKTNVIKK